MGSMIRHRFNQKADPFAEHFVASVRDDERLVAQDVLGSIAHAKALREAGLLSPKEETALVRALRRTLRDFQDGKWSLRVEDEDVHMNVEKRLGKLGAKLHAARSRNDQVALDVRLWTRDEIDKLVARTAALRSALVRKAAAHAEAILPGYTHLQRAQPVLFAHVLLSWHDMIARDESRLLDARKRVNVSPLGAAALAGTTLPIDPDVAARALGFEQSFKNSLDAVSDRDFAVEFVSACAILMTHLSQIAENLLLWSSAEFDFIELPDALCTSSSIMPQKKNADMIELVRAKAGRVTGDLVNLLTILKGLPAGYNRDLQETKPPLFDAAVTAQTSAHAVTLAIQGLALHERKMEAAAGDPALLATDLAEYLAAKGVPWRDAHGIVARIMRARVSLRDLAALRGFSPAFGADVLKILSPRESVRRRSSPGGTGVAEVKKRIRSLMK